MTCSGRIVGVIPGRPKGTNPGSVTLGPAVVMDSGFAASRRPGMTRASLRDLFPQYCPEACTATDLTGPRARALQFTLFASSTPDRQPPNRLRTFWATAASDIEGPTDLDGVGVCFETEISRGALDTN